MTERQSDHLNELLNDPAFLRGLTMRRMSRRDLIRSAGIGAGAISMGAILAACGGTSGGGGSVEATVEHGDGGGGDGGIDWNAEPNGTLMFANWPLYIDKKKVNGVVTYPSLEGFTADSGIEVTYREAINSNPEFFGKIQPQLAAGQSTGWDIIVITNGDTLNQLLRLELPRRAADGQAAELRRERERRGQGPRVRPRERLHHGVAVRSTGIGWDPVQVKALRPEKPKITSVMDLFDPAFKGKVGMFGDNADLPGLVMVGMGVAPETSTPADWQAAADLLQKQKDDGIVRQFFTQNYTNALQNGDVALTMAWSGDIFQLNLEGDVSGLQFCIPDEGVMHLDRQHVHPPRSREPGRRHHLYGLRLSAGRAGGDRGIRELHLPGARSTGCHRPASRRWPTAR